MNCNERVLSSGWILAICLAATPTFAVDLTFLVMSDVHYGQHGASSTGVPKDTNRVRMPGVLNDLPGTSYPSMADAGSVGTPRGVLILGDLTENASDSLWKQYVAVYGVNGEKVVHFPVYDGLGNHDEPGVSQVILPQFVSRSATRQNPINFDSLGYNYSWDWDGVHFVHMNLYAGGAETGYFSGGTGGNSMNSRGFLQTDLAQRVGNSGRPVIIMQHYNIRDNTFWTTAAKQQLYSTLQGYNVVAFFNGHSHMDTLYKWNNNIDVIEDGTVMEGDIMVCHITDSRLLIVNRYTPANGQNTWGMRKLDKTISMGNPSALYPDQNGALHHALFTIPESGWVQDIPEDTRFVEILDLQGREVRRLTVQNYQVTWDGTDDEGFRVHSGLYFFKLVGKEKFVFGKVLLNP